MTPERTWFVYLVQCRDNSLYCGISTNVTKRIDIHNQGKGAKYTRSRRPVILAATSGALPHTDALKLEYRIKQAPAIQKRQLILNFPGSGGAE